MRLSNTNKFVSGLALACALAAGTTLGIAQQGAPQNKTGKEHHQFGRHGGGRGGMRGFGFLRNLTLSDAQKAQIEQITSRNREAMKSLHEQQSAVRGNKDGGAFGDGTFNEAAVRQAAQARANLHVEMEVAQARMMSEVYNILTPEQKAQLATERQQREQRRQERRTRTGDGAVQSL